PGGRSRGRAGTGVLRAWRGPDAGYRNGYRTGRLKTTEGMVEYAAPQICDRAVPFRSRLREIIRGRNEELEALAIECMRADCPRAISKRCLPTSAANRC